MLDFLNNPVPMWSAIVGMLSAYAIGYLGQRRNKS